MSVVRDYNTFISTAVIEASKQVFRSRKFRDLLEVVLAFGNYMNRGERGNATGFKIASINKIMDTKSSSNSKINLLDYLVMLLDQKVCVEEFIL